MNKTCSKCGEEKSLDQFSKARMKTKKGKLYRYKRTDCKDCVREYCRIRSAMPHVIARKKAYKKQWGKRNKDKVAKYRRDYVTKHPEQTRATKRAWGKANPHKSREYRLKAKYNITQEQYNEMLIKQGGMCAGCKGGPTGKDNVLHIDHCHETGKIRGLLCTNCNQGIGNLKHKPEVLITLAEYLN